MDRIPITFEWQGRTYRGEFMPVTADGQLYYLLVNNRFQGQLSYQSTGWQWSPHHPDNFRGIDNYFGDYLTAWVG